MRRDEALRRLRESRESLTALGVTHAYLFGSVARDVATENSDIDVMVDLDEGPTGRKPLFSAFDVGGIQSKLAEILGRSVDLVVRRDAMRPGKRLRAVAESQLVDAF
ncbi:MAG: nucleotidyltransferase domain-containing protein [Xanthobacteraceae bacterium]|nr:nucleotidyltransferase domain-containing protein [Xanthobacteraceae bacterium]